MAAQLNAEDANKTEASNSALAVYQSTVYGNETLKLKENKQNAQSYVEITDKITIRDTSGEYSDTYAAKNIFNDEKESVWSACDYDGEYWIMFDCHGYQLSKIELEWLEYTEEEETVKYGCKMIKLSHGHSLKDNTFEPLFDFQCHHDSNDQTLTSFNTHHRLVKLQFEELLCEYGFALKRVKFYGILQNEDDYKTDPILYQWEEMPDHNQSDFEQDDAAENISTSHCIKCVEAWPGKVPKPQRSIASMSDSYWYSGNRKNPRKEAFLIYDVGDCSIDSLQIKLERHAVVKIFTSKKQTDAYEWNMIMINKKVKAGAVTRFYFKSVHERHIKVSFMTPLQAQFCINQLQWNGKEPVIEDESTDRISLYQASGSYRQCKAERVLQHNKAVWKSNEDTKCHLIFDCGRFEIDRIWIQFVKYSKPGTLKLRLSDVPNAYSFHTPSAQKWKFKTSKHREAEWDDVPLFETIQLNALYHGGFKRYLQLQFLDYMTDKLEVMEVRFFGKESTQIDADSEQFDDLLDKTEEKDATVQAEEMKEDATKPYKPKVVDFLPHASSGGAIQDLLDHKQDSRNRHGIIWSDQENDPFLVVDTGNNKVEQLFIPISDYDGCQVSKVYTSNRIKANDWRLLVEHRNYDVSHDSRNKIKLTDKHDKYIKIEFVDRKTKDRFSISRVWLMGEGEYLYTEQKEITMDDINQCEHINEDLIHKYRNQQSKALHKVWYGYGHQRDALEKELHAHPTDQTIWNKWIDAVTKYETADRTMSPKIRELNALLSSTLFAADEILKVAKLEYDLALKYVPQRVHIKTERLKKDIELKQIAKKAKEQYEDAKENQADDAQLIDELYEKWTQAKAKHQNMFSQFQTQLTALLTKEVQESRAFTEESNKNEMIYNEWKESIEQHPRVISDQYNVREYGKMVGWASNGNKPSQYNETQALFNKLALLFEESMAQRKQLIHKYHLFQLSGHYSFNPQFGKDTEIVWILFYCGGHKTERIELKMPGCQAGRIIVSTADELMMEKPLYGDDDEKEIRWDNFSVVKQETLDGSVEERMQNMALACSVLLHQKHARYIKIGFAEFPSQQYVASITVDRVKFYIKSDEKDEKDDDELEGGAQLDKYKLKLVESSDDIDDWSWTLESIQRAYASGPDVYMSKDGKRTPYLLFDCETRKVDKFEVRFQGQSRRAFTSFTVSTAEQKDAKEWITLFADEDIKDFALYQGTKTIEVNSNNQRYLKLSFIMKKDCPQFMMDHLKFYSIDPKEYVWDIDRGIKNLTRKIKIVDATQCCGGLIPENMLHGAGQQYHAKPPYIDHKSQIENHIRDEVCCTLNRFRNGGSISNKDKHFVKFLLCWQNAKHYDEILMTAKRTMNILKKPLIKEYHELQARKSRLLTLSLNDEHRLPKHITSNHGLLEWDYSKWYKYRKALFYPTDLKPLADEWVKMGLNVHDVEFKAIRRNGVLDKEKSFTSADELAMQYLNLIAHKLDPSFQKTMKSLFEENRKILNLKYPTGDADLGVLSGPVKTKSRQNIKIRLDYFDKPSPQCMAVLDIVRCAIVCEDAKELCHLFDLIVSKFSGKILRIKNAFDDVTKGTFGYRAVLLNIAFGDEALLPKKYQMICEVQLLIWKYYKVRKNMHLGYGIVRSEEGGISWNRQPHYVLAQDSCKFGNLDI
eukprot:506830_1